MDLHSLGMWPHTRPLSAHSVSHMENICSHRPMIPMSLSLLQTKPLVSELSSQQREKASPWVASPLATEMDMNAALCLSPLTLAEHWAYNLLGSFCISRADVRTSFINKQLSHKEVKCFPYSQPARAGLMGVEPQLAALLFSSRAWWSQVLFAPT